MVAEGSGPAVGHGVATGEGEVVNMREDDAQQLNRQHFHVFHKESNDYNCQPYQRFFRSCKKEKKCRRGILLGFMNRYFVAAHPVTNGPVLVPQEKAIWRCCSGRTPTAAPGTSSPVPMQQNKATFRCSSGQAPMAAPPGATSSRAHPMQRSREDVFSFVCRQRNQSAERVQPFTTTSHI
jgi:hypothetical protein